jgi:hypothetical protein
MLSGHSEKRRVVEARDAGVTEFLAKPIAAKSLYERILSVVLNPRSFIQTKSYFGPDRRRNVHSNYAGPERRKGVEGAKVIPVTGLDATLAGRLRPRGEAAPAPAPVEIAEPAAEPVAAAGGSSS